MILAVPKMGNSHFNFVNQNSGVKSRDSGSDQFGHSHFKGVTNGYALWSLSLNASVLASVHTYIAKRSNSPIYSITGPRMREQAQAGPGLQFLGSPIHGGLRVDNIVGVLQVCTFSDWRSGYR